MNDEIRVNCSDCGICGRPVKSVAPSRRKAGRVRTCSLDCTAALSAQRARAREVSRFWAKVNKDGPVPAHRPELGPCWIWTGQIGPRGYGAFACGSARDGSRRKDQAHRYSYILHRGPIPEGLFGCHHCDNRPCVRPTHLFAGTNDDNVNDMVTKGRQYHGERHWSAKLTAADASAIRRRYVPGVVRMADLASEFGVSLSQISNIIRGSDWKEIAS